MIAAKDSEFDLQLLTGIRVGLSKARELGCPVERMDVTASLSHGRCSLHFSPIADPGTILAGGDLSLSIDAQTKEVTTIERGQ
ncbi:MAG TPA: hypothetical protein VHE81_05975 [Lacipirellulaceae bacterium]|nr:hypothetical protein [Lacipirellulaceae bacterium]